jgi:N6-L-threonylcarbamoyladenine synthase
LKTIYLGIETSCDDTAVGIVNDRREILAESKYNQWLVHKQLGSPKLKQNSSSTSWAGKFQKKYEFKFSIYLTITFKGGVIPNLARKLHYENLIPAVSDCIEKVDSDWKNIDAVALTLKPGLEVYLL